MWNIYNCDCEKKLNEIADHSVDLIVTDPPYVLNLVNGGSRSRIGRSRKQSCVNISFMANGFTDKILDEMCRVQKKINMYIFCSKAQIKHYIEYFENKNCNWELITWCKTNAIPTCNNTFVPDVEYVFFTREPGVKLYGDCKTKSHYYVSPINQIDKATYKHPTIKPLPMIENFINNSSLRGDLVLDPFMGSGTTGVAALNMGRDFIGMEINKQYYNIAEQRITVADYGNRDELVLFGG